MKLHILETSKFKLDGGAMFGVVPKSMWQRLHPADDDNMCTWQMRCLLIEDGDRKILIDTGIGDKQDDRFRSHFYPHDAISFEAALEPLGLKKEDITDVLLTHFHFDHVGGAVERDVKGNLVPTFPNATYWTNEVHYNWAYNPNAREAASFLKENFVPLKESGVLKMIDIEAGIVFSDHITLEFVYGHTEAMMIPYIQLPSGNTLVYCADLIPSHHHIQLPYVMAYDVQPLKTLAEKQLLHERATNDRHFLFFEHDLNVACGKLIKNEKGRVVFGGAYNLEDII